MGLAVCAWHLSDPMHVPCGVQSEAAALVHSALLTAYGDAFDRELSTMSLVSETSRLRSAPVVALDSLVLIEAGVISLQGGTNFEVVSKEWIGGG